MDPEIWAALITGVAGAITGALALYSSYAQSKREEERQVRLRRLEKDLGEEVAKLNSELEEQKAVRDARRAYVYEAKKRLYEECEPVLFQAQEMAQDARYRILNLAAATRRGGLGDDGSGWLSREDYYFRSTIFLLLAPCTMFKVLQRRLTAVDLSLEPDMRRQYEILKHLWFSLAGDWALADCEPRLPYDPDRADPGQPNREALLRDDPAVYWRQGLYRGTLDMVTEALIVPATGGTKERCQSMGEFWAAYDDPTSSIATSKCELKELLFGFHPSRKPVLWRIFIAEYMLCGALLGDEPGENEVAELNWRPRGSDTSDDVVYGSIRAAQRYVRERVPAVTPLELSEEAQ